MKKILLLVLSLVAGTAAAQDGALRVVIGFPAGASLDIMTRIVADAMRGQLNRPVVVENKTGAGGRIANETVKAAAPDGNTLLLTPVATMSIFPHSFAGSLRYDPFKDFSPVAHISSFQVGLGVSCAVPAKTLAEYVALVKKDPKAGYYASAAAGSIPHFLGVMFARAAGIEMVHVPYKGTAPAMQALAAGEIAAASVLVADIGALVKGGKAKLLASAGKKRAAGYPDVPTFREAGFDMEGEGWYGLFAPAGMSPSTLERLSAAAIAAVRDASVRQKLEGMGLEPTGLPAAELGAIMKADYDKWGPVIRASGFKPAE